MCSNWSNCQEKIKILIFYFLIIKLLILCCVRVIIGNYIKKS